jgi:hypothetical protein
MPFGFSATSNEQPALRPKFTLWICSLLLLGICSGAVADELYLACHAGVSLAVADVRDVFLGEKQFLNSIQLVPVDNMAAQSTFLEKVLKMNGIKYDTIWAKKSFRDGVNAPATMANDASVLAFIKRTPGGCSYLTIEPPVGVTVIGKY